MVPHFEYLKKEEKKKREKREKKIDTNLHHNEDWLTLFNTSTLSFRGNLIRGGGFGLKKIAVMLREIYAQGAVKTVEKRPRYLAAHREF